jgi:hypothetical protein
LPAAAAYQVQLRKKAAEERQAKERSSDWQKYDLCVGDKEILGLNKRHLFLNVVSRLVEHGVSVSDLQKFLPARQFLSVPNKVTVEEFRKQASQLRNANGVPYDLRRRFLNDGELFNSEGKTWALSNQWSRYELPMLNELISKYPEAGISYKPSDEGDED